jgi:hypothetical protein
MMRKIKFVMSTNTEWGYQHLIGLGTFRNVGLRGPGYVKFTRAAWQVFLPI